MAKGVIEYVINVDPSTYQNRLIFIGVLVLILVSCMILGIYGQWYLASPRHTPEQKQSFETSLHFWIGNSGIIYSLGSYVSVAMFCLAMLTIIREMPGWKRDILTHGAALRADVREMTGKMSKVADVADSTIRAMPVTMRESVVESAAVIAQAIQAR